MIAIYETQPSFANVAAARPLERSARQRNGSVVVYTGKSHPTAKIVSLTAVRPAATPYLFFQSPSTSTSSTTVTSGFAVQVVPPKASDENIPSMLADIKRMTGWSWERLAEALGRTRQAVHNWTLGRDITPQNSERIAKLHALLRHIDRGTAKENRALLNTADGNGRIAADLLNAGKFDDVKNLLPKGSGRRDVTPWSQLADRERLEDRMHWFDRLAEAENPEPQPQGLPSAAPMLESRRPVKVRRS